MANNKTTKNTASTKKNAASTKKTSSSSKRSPTKSSPKTSAKTKTSSNKNSSTRTSKSKESTSKANKKVETNIDPKIAERNRVIKYEIKLVVLTLFTIFSYICLFTDAIGIIGLFINNLYYGLFSSAAILFPIVLFLIVFSTMNMNIQSIKFRIIISASFVFLGFLLSKTLYEYTSSILIYDANNFSIFSIDGMKMGFNLGISRESGGLFGDFIGFSLINIIGKIGTMIVVIALFIIAFMVSSRISLEELWLKNKSFIKNKKAEVDYKKQIRKEEIENQIIEKRKQEEAKAKDLDSTDYTVNPNVHPLDNMDEVRAMRRKSKRSEKFNSDTYKTSETTASSESVDFDLDTNIKEDAIVENETQFVAEKSEVKSEVKAETKKTIEIPDLDYNAVDTSKFAPSKAKPKIKFELGNRKKKEEESKETIPQPSDMDETKVEQVDSLTGDDTKPKLKIVDSLTNNISEPTVKVVDSLISDDDLYQNDDFDSSFPDKEEYTPFSRDIDEIPPDTFSSELAPASNLGQVDNTETLSTKIKEKDIDENTKIEVAKAIEQSTKITYEDYKLPSINLLAKNKANTKDVDKSIYYEMAKQLEETLNNFNIKADVLAVKRGPAITMFEIQLSPGTKVSKIVGLGDDIALSLAVSQVRIAPIPGKSAIGIEVPNKETSMVTLREVLADDAFKKYASKLGIGFGKDISGNSIVGDLAKMPHLLIAGATGSGKSVCINTIITSILYKAKPDEVKFLMIDPKVVELSIYNGIPHLILPVVTDPKKASVALNWAVQEMTRRYGLFAENSVRDLASYNRKAKEHELEILTQIVVIIDELSDLMMAAPKVVEEAICRLAQMARAAGIHLIVATQRPSVDVITGLIKANIPSRIAFSVSSSIDSRTILDMGGAERLLGRGDMLYYPSGSNKPERVQGGFVSDEEIESIVDFVKNQTEEVEYRHEILETVSTKSNDFEADEYLEDAIRIVVENGQASASMMQRKFRVGYNRAARIIDEMEDRGIVGPHRGSKPREVLISKAEFEQLGSNKPNE